MSVTLLTGLYVQAQRAYVFNRFTTADGLNTNKVKCVWQDKTGFIWVGSENGIQRFDGRKFINFRVLDEEQQLPPVGVNEILDAGNGKMWVRQGTDIGRFNTITFAYQKALLKPKGDIAGKTNFHLYRDSKGHTFLCIRGYGLLYYNEAANTFGESGMPIQIPPGWTVNKLYEHKPTGDYYISSDSGLAIYKSSTRELIYRGHNPQRVELVEKDDLYNVLDFLIDQNNTWWVLFWKFLPGDSRPAALHYDPVSRQYLNDTAGIRSGFLGYTELNQVIETRSGQVWIAGVNALFNYDKEEKQFYQNKKLNPADYDIKFRDIYQLYEGSEDILWISTDNGLYVARTKKKNIYHLIFNNEPGEDIFINAMLETKNRENWVGTWGSGVLFFDKNFQNLPVNLSKTRGKKYTSEYAGVWDLCQHSKTQKIWSACQAGRIAVYDAATKTIVHWLKPPVFEEATVRQVKEDPEGNLWFASQRGHLVFWKNNPHISDTGFQLVNNFNSIIHRLFFDKQKRLWVTTQGKGVYVLDPVSYKILAHFTRNDTKDESLTSNQAIDVQQYNDSIFFVNTGGISVVNVNSGKIRKITLYQGLPAAFISQMALDDEGMLWLITNNGLSSYNYTKNNFTTYSNHDGIMFAGKTGSTTLQMQNGELWFGGENVAFGFQPDSLKLRDTPPNVTLTDFRLINDFIPLDSLLTLPEVKLNSSQHSLAIYFSALSFTQQDKLSYYYKMEGIDRSWIKAERNLVANYTYLPPGHHTFKVYCENMQGVASKNSTTLKIYIAPPFYKTGWFLLLLAILAAVLIYLIYRLRINKLLAVEKLRNKVARDLHDDMGSTLSTINILSSMAKTRLNENVQQTSEYISKISDNSQRMMEAMDDIVWSIKPDNDTMQKITSRMREFATSLVEAKDIDIDFRVEENVKDVKLNMEARRDFFLIFKEAVNNVAKYSKCSNLGIQVAYHQKRLVLVIKDNGIGFNVDEADSGNGLGNMQKRAEALGARLQVYSKPGVGTQVTLNMPVH